MERLSYSNGVYRTEPRPLSMMTRAFPSLTYYPRFLRIIFASSAKAKRGAYDNVDWCHSSIGILRAIESVGVKVEITGIEHVEQLNSPCVLIANHMSMLETVILPIIIQPIRDVTFVVKQGLLEYPVFKHIMRTRDPIAVTRTHPREDLRAVLDGGADRLNRGISIIVFPQTTRTPVFDPAQFNSIGVKLAQKADVPVVPLALLSDAWGNGRWLKDFGPIDPSKTVRFAFGPPMRVQGRGAPEHQAITDFITSKLSQWG